MTIKELFEGAIENESIDLQALIMFLVFEKKVLTMEDDSSELHLYYLEKHRERMNQLIIDYKKKMNMKYGLSCFRVQGEHGTYYIAAYNEAQAVYMANRDDIGVSTVKWFNEDTEMLVNGTPILLKDMLDKPRILGGNQDE